MVILITYDSLLTLQIIPNNCLQREQLLVMDPGLMKGVHLLPWNLGSFTPRSPFISISFPFFSSHCLMFLLSLSSIRTFTCTFFPQPSSTCATTRSWNVTTYAVGTWSHSQNSHQHEEWKSKNKKEVRTTCRSVLHKDQAALSPSKSDITASKLKGHILIIMITLKRAIQHFHNLLTAS